MNIFHIGRHPMRHPTAARPIVLPAPESRLTTRDLMALAEWIGHADQHGYHRLLIEAGNDANLPEDGGYALVYAEGRAWANWGLARCSNGIAVWHCGSGADNGCFPNMLQALQNLPPAWSPPRPITPSRPNAMPDAQRSTRQRAPATPQSNVIPLRSLRVRLA